jgi:hypothetical protein
MTHDELMTCVEEAAHCVVADVLQVPILEASVLANQRNGTRGDFSIGRSAPDERIKIAMAGIMAQRKLDPDCDPTLQRHAVDAKVILAADAAMLPHSAHETDKILERNWDSVERLACAFHRYKRMNGEQINSILKGQDMSPYKGFTKLALDAARKHPQQFEAFIRAGGTLPMHNNFAGAADVKDSALKRAMARDQSVEDPNRPAQVHVGSVRDQAEPRNGTGNLHPGNPPVRGERQDESFLRDASAGASAAQTRGNPRGFPTTASTAGPAGPDQFSPSGMPASAGAGPSIADQERTRLQRSSHGSGDQTSGGEQELREVCERLGLPPEICDKILAALGNGEEPEGMDEPFDLPTGGTPRVGAGANAGPAQGGLRSTGYSGGAHDSARHRAPPAPRWPALDHSVGAPDPHCPSLYEAWENVLLARSLDKDIAQDGTRNGKERAVLARRQMAQDAHAGEAAYLADCPWASKIGFV